jgi:2-oxoglutarate/2-oxoacid ferredoxin oxidoreductase subunit beta
VTTLTQGSQSDHSSRRVSPFKPSLLQTPDHEFCAGCGEPVAMRIILEVIEEMELATRTIGVIGHGCYGTFVTTIDVDVLQCLHGRAPSCATGIKRMRPECAVFTLTGDGDMVNEGLQEVLHTAARGESVTCILLNNGVFGDTGGHMTATTVVGQRTKTSLQGRDPEYHGYPIPISDLISQLQGVAYVARGAVHTAGLVARTKRMLRQAFELQMEGSGFTFVEILTMCPTGWFVGTLEGPQYLTDSLESAYPLGELKTP